MSSPRVGSALLAFRGENVRSFAEPFELDLQATAMAEPGVPRLMARNEKGSIAKVLPAAGIFGANASGKTNVLRALEDMRRGVLLSFRYGVPQGGFQRKPFMLDASFWGKPSRYEVDIILDGVRHRYGYEVDDRCVVREWATRWPKGAPARIFEREGNAVSHGSGLATMGRRVESLLRPNALFLSTAAQANHPELTALFGWFRRNLLLAAADSRALRHAFTAKLWGDADTRQAVSDLVHAADLGIVDVHPVEFDPEERERLERAIRILNGVEPDKEIPDLVPYPGLRLLHQGAGEGPVEMAPEDESLGTLVWLGLVGPAVSALRDGSVLLADELDASLHPLLVRRLVSLFQDPESNPRCAQLIFNAHDVALLGDSRSPRPLGRDQVWFTTKLPDGRTRLYPLTDFNPRREEALGRRYLAGYYGGTPMLAPGDFAAALESLEQ